MIAFSNLDTKDTKFNKQYNIEDSKYLTIVLCLQNKFD